MKTNVQITAVKKEFKNGQNGYEVKIEGMEEKLDCKMNFHEPLKAMRYMFLLSKKLELKIDSIQLAALSMEYQRAKDAEQKATAIAEATEAENDDSASPSGENTEVAPSTEQSEQSAPKRRGRKPKAKKVNESLFQEVSA